MRYYHIKINHVSLNLVMAKSFYLKTYRCLRGEGQFRSISRYSNRLFSCTRTLEMVSLKVFIFVISSLRTETGLRRLETSQQFFSKTQKTLQPIRTEQESMLRWYVPNALLSKLGFLVSNVTCFMFQMEFFDIYSKVCGLESKIFDWRIENKLSKERGELDLWLKETKALTQFFLFLKFKNWNSWVWIFFILTEIQRYSNPVIDTLLLLAE